MSTKDNKKFTPIKVPNRRKDAGGDDDRGTQKSINLIPANNARQAGKNYVRDSAAVNYGKNLQESEHAAFDFDQIMNKQTVALDLLKHGYSQSYIDFFYITSNTIPEVIEPSDAYKSSLEKNKDMRKVYGEEKEELRELRDKLIRAELCLRTDKMAAAREYSDLADNFYGRDFRDYQTATYFYKRCVSLAKSQGVYSNDAKWECLSLIGLGKCFAKLDRLDRAIENHENILGKAQIHGLRDITNQVSTELIDIYSQMASHYDNKDDEESLSMALLYLEKCLEAASKGNNQEKEGLICHKIGLIYLNKGDYKKALGYQIRDLKIARETLMDETKKDKKPLIEAYSAIAKTYINLGDIDQALEHLNQYYKIAKDAKKSNFQADAAFYLAKVWGMKGNSSKSIEFYQQHFDSAKNERLEKNRRLIDKARVYLGMARANVNINNFIKNVGNTEQNIAKLLEWKFKKEK